MWQKFEKLKDNKLPLEFDAWKLAQGEKLEFILISLKKGEFIEAHINNLDVYFFIFSGVLKLTVDNYATELESGNLMSVKQGAMRAAEAIDNNTNILVIKEL